MIYVAFNPQYTNKIDKFHPEKRKYNNTFQNVELSSLRDLAVLTYKGHPYCAQHAHVHHKYIEDGQEKETAFRHGENFIRTNVFSLDFDKGRPEDSIALLMLRPFFAQYASYLYATVSSTPSAPRTRVVFLCDVVIEDIERYALLTDAFTWHFKDADQACKDPMRIFAGSKLSHDLRLTENVLPLSVLDNFARRYQDHLRAEQEERRRKNSLYLEQGDVTIERIRAALRHISPDKQSLSYYDWMRVVAGIHNAFPDEVGMSLAEEWSPSRNSGEIASMFRSFNHHRGKEVRVNTLFMLAKERGWTEPRPDLPYQETVRRAVLKGIRRY